MECVTECVWCGYPKYHRAHQWWCQLVRHWVNPPTPTPVMPSRQLSPCGTQAAYQRHLYRGEDTCPDCRKAHRDYQSGRSRL